MLLPVFSGRPERLHVVDAWPSRAPDGPPGMAGNSGKGRVIGDVCR